MNGEDLKTSMSLSLDFKDDQTIEVRAIELKGAIAHNVVMKTLTEFAKRLANTNGIPARFEDV